MSDNFKVSSDIDTLLRKQTKEEAATFLGLEDVSAVWGQVTGTLSNQTDLQGALDTNASGVAANASNIATNTAAIAINTAKTGITSGQASAIVANTAKVGITPTQASDITANNAKVGITPTQASDIATNTSNIATKAPIVDPTFTNDITVDGKIVTPEIITAVSGNTSEDLLISTPNGIGLVDGGDIKIRAGGGGNIALEAQLLQGGGRVDISGDKIYLSGQTLLGSVVVVDNGGLAVQSGYGLKFGDSSAKELKDYSYGSFLPYLMLGSGTTQQSAYATQQGYYVKIGRSVTVNISIRVTDFDTAFKTAADNLDIGITGLPHSAKIEGSDGPDTMIVRVHPKKGWIQLGGSSYNGAVGSSPDGLVYFEKNVVQGGSAAGDGWNYSRIKVGDFNVHPFNFTADGTKAFTFQISGTYITDDDV
jgi:hypothetical protein